MDDNPHHDGGRYADCRKALEEQVFQYRSLSSIARKYLPLAMDMHERGEPWGRIARKLKVSKTSLYNWRRISQNPGQSHHLITGKDLGILPEIIVITILVIITSGQSFCMEDGAGNDDRWSYNFTEYTNLDEFPGHLRRYILEAGEIPAASICSESLRDWYKDTQGKELPQDGDWSISLKRIKWHESIENTYLTRVSTRFSYEAPMHPLLNTLDIPPEEGFYQYWSYLMPIIGEAIYITTGVYEYARFNGTDEANHWFDQCFLLANERSRTHGDMVFYDFDMGDRAFIREWEREWFAHEYTRKGIWMVTGNITIRIDLPIHPVYQPNPMLPEILAETIGRKMGIPETWAMAVLVGLGCITRRRMKRCFMS